MEKLGGILIALLIGGFVVYGKFSTKNENMQEMRDIAYEVIESLPDYDAHASEYERYFNMYHDDAFDHHYRMGGKYSSGSFDEYAYWDEMLTSMIRSASNDGEDEIADNFRALMDELND